MIHWVQNKDKENVMTNQTIIDFRRGEYEGLCIEMRELMREEKELASKKDALKKSIIELAGGDRMEYGIKLQYRVSKGSIDYPKFIKSSGVEESTLEFYRKADREYWEVRSY